MLKISQNIGAGIESMTIPPITAIDFFNCCDILHIILCLPHLLACGGKEGTYYHILYYRGHPPW